MWSRNNLLQTGINLQGQKESWKDVQKHQFFHLCFLTLFNFFLILVHTSPDASNIHYTNDLLPNYKKKKKNKSTKRVYFPLYSIAMQLNLIKKMEFLQFK